MGQLQRADEGYVLDGKALASGDSVEILLSGARWLRCRFVWSGEEADAPVFGVMLGGARLSRGVGLVLVPGRVGYGGDGVEAILRVDGADLADLEVRWPAGQS